MKTAFNILAVATLGGALYVAQRPRPEARHYTIKGAVSSWNRNDLSGELGAWTREDRAAFLRQSRAWMLEGLERAPRQVLKDATRVFAGLDFANVVLIDDHLIAGWTELRRALDVASGEWMDMPTRRQFITDAYDNLIAGILSDRESDVTEAACRCFGYCDQLSHDPNWFIAEFGIAWEFLRAGLCPDENARVPVAWHIPTPEVPLDED
jgi:hypothetical protein